MSFLKNSKRMELINKLENDNNEYKNIIKQLNNNLLLSQSITNNQNIKINKLELKLNEKNELLKMNNEDYNIYKLKQLNEKGLKSNHYANGRFQSL